MSYSFALLQALAPGAPVSGEALGRALGVSRAAVWKGIRRLQALGLEIEAMPGRGYRLVAPLELLEHERILTALPGPVGARLARFDVLAQTDSTNARVLEAELPVGALMACVAEYQSAGRGRRGRRWLAPPGGALCLSVGGRLAAAPADFATLPVAVGVACAEVLEREGIAGLGLKWPNDLLLDGGKLGGILIELRGEAQGPVSVAVGLGINLRLGAAARAEIQSAGGLRPAELAEVLHAPPRNRLAAVLVAAIAGCLERRAGVLDAAVLAGWHRRDALLGRPVCIEDAGAGLAGLARGIDGSGALLLDIGEGPPRRVTAGEASLRMLV